VIAREFRGLRGTGRLARLGVALKMNPTHKMTAGADGLNAR
jgi:hypothetical protein